jgi:hypothetical protein
MAGMSMDEEHYRALTQPTVKVRWFAREVTIVLFLVAVFWGAFWVMKRYGA